MAALPMARLPPHRPPRRAAEPDWALVFRPPEGRAISRPLRAHTCASPPALQPALRPVRALDGGLHAVAAATGTAVPPLPAGGDVGRPGAGGHRPWAARGAHPSSRVAGFFLWLRTPDLRDETKAQRQIARIAFDPKDVRHIALMHLDFDHAGGLDDVPKATVTAGAGAGRCAVPVVLARPPAQAAAADVHPAAPAHLCQRRGRALVRLWLCARPGGPAARDAAGATARPHAGPRRRGGAVCRRLIAAGG